MIEGPAAPPASRGPGPPRRFPLAKLWAKIRTIVTLLRRRALSAQALPADRSDLFLWRLQLVDRVFWAVLAGLACYLVIDLTLLQPKPPALAMVSGGTASGPGAAALSADLRPVTVEDRLRPVHEYREALTNRNPFELAVSAAARALITQPTAQDNPLQKQVSTLSVVGINRGRVPEALIEDTDTRRTYFVTVGDRVNEMKVKTIDEEGVVLTYQGEDVRLPL